MDRIVLRKQSMNARQPGRRFRVTGRPKRVRKHSSPPAGPITLEQPPAQRARGWTKRSRIPPTGPGDPPGVCGLCRCVRSPDVPSASGQRSPSTDQTGAKTHGARKRTNPPVRGVSVTHGMPRHCASASPTEGSARGRLTAPHPQGPVRRPANRADARPTPKHHRGSRRSRRGAPHTNPAIVENTTSPGAPTVAGEAGRSPRPMPSTLEVAVSSAHTADLRHPPAAKPPGPTRSTFRYSCP